VIEKIAEIFYGNIKVLLFKDDNINNQYLKITALTKFCGSLCKKLD
jgi:hypothetical protein